MTELNWYIFVVNSPTLKLLTSVYRTHSYFSSAFHSTISSCNYCFQFLTLRVFLKPVPIMICLHSSDTFLVKATRGFNSVISSGPHLISLHRAFNMITHLSLKPLSLGCQNTPHSSLVLLSAAGYSFSSKFVPLKWAFKKKFLSSNYFFWGFDPVWWL